MLLFIIAWSLIISGGFFLLSSIIGMFRFLDLYSKVHAAGVADSLGIPLIYIGVALLQPSIALAMKVGGIVIVMFILNPMVTHTLVKLSWLTSEPIAIKPNKIDK